MENLQLNVFNLEDINENVYGYVTIIKLTQ